MLAQERDFKYVVYPPWAEASYAYSWSDLPEIFRDPLKTGRLKPYAGDLERQPSLYNPPAHFLPGCAGGGIVIVGPAESKAINVVLFSGVANISPLDDMRPARETFSTFVGIIEPFGATGRAGSVGKRPTSYRIRATAEHADSAGDSVYWVFCLDEEAELAEALQQIPQIAASFGLRAVSCGDVVGTLGEETRGWLRRDGEKRMWFEIENVDSRAGLQFAILVYVASHLKEAIGTLRWSHLIAQIEGRPNSRSAPKRFSRTHEE